MKKSKFSEAQILKVLQMQQEGKKVQEICREQGISEPTFYKWKPKYSGMTLSELSRLNDEWIAISLNKECLIIRYVCIYPDGNQTSWCQEETCYFGRN